VSNPESGAILRRAFGETGFLSVILAKPAEASPETREGRSRNSSSDAQLALVKSSYSVARMVRAHDCVFWYRSDQARSARSRHHTGRAQKPLTRGSKKSPTARPASIAQPTTPHSGSPGGQNRAIINARLNLEPQTGLCSAGRSYHPIEVASA